jgi:nitrogen-specific signal transduction histidine kinase
VDPKEAVRGFIVVFEDFTDRKKMEDALREEKERAEEATRLKDKFVTLVTHDLRSPLGTILAFLKMLKGTPNIAAERRDEILGRAIGSAESSLEMIENLLDINRLQSGKLQPTFSLFMAHFPVADAVALFTAAAAEKNITLEVSIPRSLHLFGDRALVAEVVKNIISNAIKFSHPGSAVKVHIPPDRPTTIAVEDSGAGIPAERMETLFRSDVKTSTPGTAGERGSGFGLPLCREIMEAHGGSLTVTSEVGKGSIFYAELPRRRPVALVIAPDQKILTTTSTLLASLDMQVHEAHSVATGAEYLAMQEPSVIVLQVSVTTHAAFDLIDQIKFHPLSHTVPILALAPNDCADCRDKAFAVGADDIADIPIRPDDLLPRIKRLLAKTVR